MSTKYYADRGALYIEGKFLTDVVSIDVSVDEAISVKETMTADKVSLGYAKGNKKVTGSFQVEIEDEKAQIDLAFAYGRKINVVFAVGKASERLNIKGLVQNSLALKSGVGTSDKTISFLALDAINEGGPSVNSPIGL